jgi:hypothetical protein
MREVFDELLTTHAIQAVVFGALAALIVLSARLSKPKRQELSTDFPAPVGMRIVLWVVLGLFTMLIIAAFDVGWDWLALIFAVGPLLIIANWPATISINDLHIAQSAWSRRYISILWSEVVSIKLTKSGDALLLTGIAGQKIKISNVQVGINQLISEIARRTGKPVPAWDPAGQGKLF